MQAPWVLSAVGILGAAGIASLWYYLKVVSSIPKHFEDGLFKPSTDYSKKETLKYSPEEIDSLSWESKEFIKKVTASRTVLRKRKLSIPEKLFRAGLYRRQDYQRFVLLQIVSVFVGIIVVPLVFWFISHHSTYTFFAVAIGILMGLIFPFSWLDRVTLNRTEDILFHLPLVIEQIAIGVSGSLVIGTCISNLVDLAQERDSHNSVTELFAHVQRLIKSGYGLEEALTEIAEASGISQIEHSFNYLIQCSKHGGEISRQLQELADSTMIERNIQVQGRIAALPVKATAPLGSVFAGFLTLLMSGVFIRVMSMFH